MPTGFTNDIYDGSDMSLRSFALKCAYNFVELRDDVPLPHDHRPIVKSHSSIVENLERAKRNLEHFLDLAKNHSNLELLYQKDMDERDRRISEYFSLLETHSQRYKAMKKKVENWNAPYDLVPLKEFMLKQLDESYAHDCCNDVPSSWEETPSFDKWFHNKLDTLVEDVKFYTEELIIQNRITNEANDYLETLYDELDKIDPVLKPTHDDGCTGCVNSKGCITCTDHDQKQTM